MDQEAGERLGVGRTEFQLRGVAASESNRKKRKLPSLMTGSNKRMRYEARPSNMGGGSRAAGRMALAIWDPEDDTLSWW